MIRTPRVRHIHILVRSLDASLRFYEAVFGSQELFREDELVFIRTPGTEDLITFHEDAHSKDVGTSGGVRHSGSNSWTLPTWMRRSARSKTPAYG